MNKAIIQGRVGQEPTYQNNCCKFSVATTKSWTDKNGQKQEKTQWHNCVTFNKTSEFVSKYVEKGGRILVEGEIEYSEHDGKKYTSILVSNVEIIDWKKQQETQTQPQQTPTNDDDDLPF